MVSVVIPVYNRENSIKAAVESVLKQTYSELEIIIVDDGSTDNTRQIIESIKDQRIRYLYQENKGACNARNRGIKNCKGEFIAFHDSDDIWHSEKIEKQLSIFSKKNVDIVFCKMNQIKEDGTVIVIPTQISGGIIDKNENYFGIGTQSLVCKREVFNNDLFDESLPRFQEYELLLRLSRKYSIFCIDEGLVDYYIGDDSISSNSSKLLIASQKIIEKHKPFSEKFPEAAKAMSNRLYEEAKSTYINNNRIYERFLICSWKAYKTPKGLIKIIFSKLGLFSLIVYINARRRQSMK